MSAPAKPWKNAQGPEAVRDQLYRTAASSAALGLIAGVLFYHFVATPSCALEPQRAVSAVLMGVGQHLCKDWSGLRNVEWVSYRSYTSPC